MSELLNPETAKLDHHGLCPKCGADWDGGDIFEHLKELRAAGDSFYGPKTDAELQEIAGHYGWTPETPKRFSKLIGVELPYGHPDHYDGVSFWRCPECAHEWPVFESENSRSTVSTTQQLLAKARRYSDKQRSKTAKFLDKCQKLLLEELAVVPENETRKIKLSGDDALDLLRAIELAILYTPGDVNKTFIKPLKQIAKRITKAWGFEVK